MTAKIKKKTATTTLRSLLGKIKDSCDFIVSNGDRFMKNKREYWRFNITRNELRLIQGSSLINSFNLDQQVKKGKGVKLKANSGDFVTVQFIKTQSLSN